MEVQPFQTARLGNVWHQDIQILRGNAITPHVELLNDGMVGNQHSSQSFHILGNLDSRRAETVLDSTVGWQSFIPPYQITVQTQFQHI
jgi:hypothetical protein